MRIFIESIINMGPELDLTDSEIDDLIDVLADASGRLGYNLLATVALLNADPVQRAALASAFLLLRPVLSDLFGISGTPKVDVDLRPSGEITNLRAWERNPFTKQFVTWGEGGFAFNLSPEISRIADNNYSLIDDVNTLGNLRAHPDDNALTTDAPGGWMVPFAGYDGLTHGYLIADARTAGENWVKTLTAPVTSLRLKGPVEVADRGNRYYVVSPEYTFDFLPEF